VFEAVNERYHLATLAVLYLELIERGRDMKAA